MRFKQLSIVIVSFLIICIYSLRVNGQIAEAESEVLYLFMGYQKQVNESIPDDEFDINTYYPITLWSLRDEKLLLVDTLNYNQTVNTELEEVYHFPDLNWFFFREQVQYTRENLMRFDEDNFPSYNSILDYSAGELILRKKNQLHENKDVRGMSYKQLLLRDSLFLMYSSVNFRSKPPKRFAIDKEFNFYELGSSDFLNVENFGTPGFFGKYWGGYTFTSGGILRLGMHITSDNIENNPISKIQVPNDLKRTKTRLGILFEKPTSRYLIAAPSPYDDDTRLELGNQIWVFDKHRDEWEVLQLPGGFARLSLYKDWIYGTKVLSTEEETKDIRRLMKANENRYFTMHGRAPKFTMQSGVLYLYHIPSAKLIEWDTKEPDSELLMIEDGWIHFRVFDELKKVKIDEVNKEIAWSTEEVLIKDAQVVPYVHHVFYAKGNMELFKIEH